MLWFLLFNTISMWIITSEHWHSIDIKRCGTQSGVYIINLRITIEQQALIMLQEYMSQFSSLPMDYRTTAEMYFGSIFEELNKQLYPFGVTVRADYAQLIMENFPFMWDKTYCSEQVPVISKTEVAVDYFKQVGGHGVGNRLLMFYCPNIEQMTTTIRYISKIRYCGRALGVLFHDPTEMRDIILDGIMDMFGYGTNKLYKLTSREFNVGLCGYAHDCVSQIGSMVGQYVNDMQNIKDINGNHYYLPVDSQMRVHGVFDNSTYRSGYKGGTQVFPTADYVCDDSFFPLSPN